MIFEEQPLPRFDDSNYRDLLRDPATENGIRQYLPRRTVCGSAEAMGMGLAPVLDYPDMLPDPKDFKEIIAYCHEKKIFPMYHRQASGLNMKPYQNGYGFCWSYGAIACMEQTRAVEGQAPVKLGPFSLGWLVNWRNQGYYLDRTIAALRDRGAAPESFCPEYVLEPQKFKVGWEQEALKYRLLGTWDTRRSEGTVKMIQQALAILKTGRPGYIAYDWWGHALQCAGLVWDESQPNNVGWALFNSHKDGLIELAGSRGVPDEFYGFGGTTIA